MESERTLGTLTRKFPKKVRRGSGSSENSAFGVDFEREDPGSVDLDGGHPSYHCYNLLSEREDGDGLESDIPHVKQASKHRDEEYSRYTGAVAARGDAEGFADAEEGHAKGH